MDIESRLANLERLVNSFIKSQSRKDTYDGYDKTSIRKTNSEQTRDITDNRAGIEESFETSLANADDIADVRTALEEVYEMINMEE